MDTLRHQKLTRYVVPLREGGSLPALAEADDGFKYVVKFRGAGHGPKALIAELIGGEVARMMGLNVPELVFLDVDSRFGITEADEEIQDLLKASQGLNIGLHYLSGALTVDPYTSPVDAVTASRTVWTDAFLTNVDRTVRNTNMLLWHGREIWLIDHGAGLMFHHSWTDPMASALSPFAYIKDHALLHKASLLKEADELAHKVITPAALREITDMIPDEWLRWPGAPAPEADMRRTYHDFLVRRLENSEIFLRQAIDARKSLI